MASYNIFLNTFWIKSYYNLVFLLWQINSQNSVFEQTFIDKIDKKSTFKVWKIPKKQQKTTKLLLSFWQDKKKILKFLNLK